MSPPLDHMQMLQGLGTLLQTPLARGAMRYWWVTVPLGALGWHYWQERKKAGEATVGNIVKDMVPAVGLVGTLLMLNATLEKQEEARAAKTNPIPAGPIRDAEFSTSPKKPGPVAAAIVQ